MTEPLVEFGSVDLTVMLPAYEEADTLRDLLPTVKAAADTLTPDYEILVVDTETAMDNTAEVCAINGVRHIRRSGGNQYGDAVRTGVAEARGTYLLCMDADGSHSPSYFAAMWAERERFDIVIGSRYVMGGRTENPAILIWMSYVLNLTFRAAFNIRAMDVTNSFRLYRTALLKQMKMESNDFDIIEEILIKAVICRPPARVVEVPVTFGRRKAGVSKRKLLQFAVSYLSILAKLRRIQKVAQKENKSK